MTEQHTPGPWKAIKNGAILYIATTNRKPFGPRAVAGLVATEADARLMAAAPELLDAIEKAHAELEECGTRWHQQSALNRAAREALIARVRGDDTKWFHK